MSVHVFLFEDFFCFVFEELPVMVVSADIFAMMFSYIDHFTTNQMVIYFSQS